MEADNIVEINNAENGEIIEHSLAVNSLGNKPEKGTAHTITRFKRYNSSTEGLDSAPVSPCEAFRLTIKGFIEWLPFRVGGLLLILIDVILVIIDVATEQSHLVYDVVAMVIVTAFMVEISLRIFAKTPAIFFSKREWYNVLDLFIIVISFIMTIVYLSVDLGTASFARLIVAGRFVRIVVFVRLFTERKNVEAGARLAVSQNKMRYREDGFDLDLCYVTGRIIAMSFPSSGKMALYRNPISEVARFLDTKHNDHYRVYNMCSERGYDESYFHDRVYRVKVDDHNVPTLSELQHACKTIKEWMSEDPENIIAVHCKGGKGRTGTLISAWLVESGEGQDAKESLDIFTSQRTDFSQDTKMQGVETPTQVRYVGYYETAKNMYNNEAPPKKYLKITTIVIHGIAGVGAGNGSDLRLELFQSKELTFECSMESKKNCVISHDSKEDKVEVLVHGCPTLEDDVKIMFHCSTKSLPKYYENCAFYFWFHTSFVENKRLLLKRDEIDNTHKPKVYTIYRECFAVEILFDEVLPESK